MSATIAVSLEHGGGGKHPTFETAMGALRSRFKRLTISPTRTYTVNGQLTTWFMLYNGKTCVGSLYEKCTNDHSETLAYPQCIFGERLFEGGPYREQNHGMLESGGV